MTNIALRWFAVLSMLSSSLALAQDASDEGQTPSTPRAPRVSSIVISTTKLLNKDIGDTSTGAGLGVNWEFFTSERSSLAIHAAFRQYMGSLGTSTNQLSYGLLMKHMMQDTRGIHASGIYLNYGLLMQVIRKSGVSESGTAHDTKLAAGYDFGGNRHWSLEAAYHYSRIKYFETEPINADYAELALSCRMSSPPQ
jgi:hypothetical protein